jgi:hypothetical protein
MNWKKFGTDMHFTQSGKPFKTEQSAQRSPVYKGNNARVESYGDGFVVCTGERMSKDQAKQFLECVAAIEIQYQHPMGNASKNLKPFVLDHPSLAHKRTETQNVLEMNYWQMPYEEAKVKFRGLPRSKWQEKRMASE